MLCFISCFFYRGHDCGWVWNLESGGDVFGDGGWIGLGGMGKDEGKMG